VSGRDDHLSACAITRSRILLLTAVLLGCIGASSQKAMASPIILPSAHPIATAKTIAIELVPPQKAKVCGARIGRNGHSTRRFPVKLGGPSRRLSWHVAASGDARWTLVVTCGTRSNPASLGTTHRTFMLRGGGGHPRLQVSRGSFRSTRGFLPAHAPPPLPTARASSVSSEADTPAASQCKSNPYMSSAYGVGLDYASRVGFTPTENRVSNLEGLWHSIEECIHLPDLLNESRESMFKQMACEEFYGPAPGPGVTYDLNGWWEDPTWEVAMKSASRCQKWPNVPEDEANGYIDGWVVQGSLDTSSQKAAYLVEGELGTNDWQKDHILTTQAYGCTLQSHKGPLVVPSDYLDEMLPGNGPNIGNSACDAVPPSYGPPPGAQAGTLYLDQGPAAPAGYFYAVSLVGYPASSAVAITCRDSVSPGGFLTFTMTTNASGDATSTNGCYSGDGPEHWVTALGNESNRVSWGGGSSGSPPSSPPPAQQTWSEQETPNHPVNTFTDYHNASGLGPAIAAGQWVEVSCKVYDPTIASVNPDGYWYRIASSPWNNAYYSPANTFMNGDPYGGPYTHNTDFAVPNC
jgi:hypothetical protein